jgi:hypothetical protein
VALTVSLPAGLTAPAVAPASSLGGSLPLPGAFALPSSPLLAQAFSPLSGVAAAGSAGTAGESGPALVRAPADAAAPGDVGRLVVVAQALDTNPDGTAPGSQGSGWSGKAAFSPALVERVLDAVFGLWDWFRSTPVPIPAVRWITAPAAETEADAADKDGAAPALPAPAGDDPPDGTSPWVWAGAGALAAAAVLGGEHAWRARGRADERRPWTVDPGLPVA